ncbi:MAG: molybdenum cofactor biosynthesis protein MoaE [Longimicrobiales bacterium]
MIHADVVDGPIAPAEVLARVGSDRDGAALLFVGVVRDHDGGRAVEGMRYDAYREMAVEVLEAIAEEAGERAGSDRVAVVHRVGELQVGDVSVAIAVSTPHRAESFDAARYVIEQIKLRLPVWKKEHYVDGQSAWKDGCVPVADGPGRTP